MEVEADEDSSPCEPMDVAVRVGLFEQSTQHSRALLQPDHARTPQSGGHRLAAPGPVRGQHAAGPRALEACRIAARQTRQGGARQYHRLRERAELPRPRTTRTTEAEKS